MFRYQLLACCSGSFGLMRGFLAMTTKVELPDRPELPFPSDLHSNSKKMAVPLAWINLCTSVLHFPAHFHTALQYSANFLLVLCFASDFSCPASTHRSFSSFFDFATASPLVIKYLSGSILLIVGSSLKCSGLIGIRCSRRFSSNAVAGFSGSIGSPTCGNFSAILMFSTGIISSTRYMYLFTKGAIYARNRN